MVSLNKTSQVFGPEVTIGSCLPSSPPTDANDDARFAYDAVFCVSGCVCPVTKASSLTAVWFFPKDSMPEKTALRLDSNVYRYEFAEGKILIEEIYTVKGGAVIQLKVSTWTKEEGLQGKHHLNKYHR